MEKFMEELTTALNDFFDKDEIEIGIYRAIREMTKDFDKENYSYEELLNKDVKKYTFKDKYNNMTFYILEEASKIFIFENYMVNQNEEYTKKVITIRGNYDEKDYIVEHEIFNGDKPYEKTAFRIDKKINILDEKGLKKVL